jgi:hypothetical protein
MQTVNHEYLESLRVRTCILEHETRIYEVVRLTGRETRYKFSGVLVAGVEDAFARIGEERDDWQKSAFPLPWNDSPGEVKPDVSS